ncbi:unnamed protein product [Penicillium nalgiovense]|uniref:Uncharacterized protein n=1 Tax=Penicillium nalgiovense TaxID=60175 RepID=A0A9W4HM77_PENNA|nr:unnamed protein product [Penicillium nalgiovense]CAG8010198.1 unnamed protein product [Penicillium nalgiovense]CAG8019708.1 unnamed protein product [Penicillium nalgiovense]CAG8033116.1 unnamed protein product [Penicillium nalgiovense]CAG8061662.1 unnamed protein product [Penicillium nalgiovense]
MKLTSKPSKHMNGTTDTHESAKTKTQSLSQPLSRPSIEDSPTTPNPTMSSSSRDLVPPSGLNRLPPPLSMSTPLPPLPARWEGTEDMKLWLHTKMEEDRRRQQEERTYQATLVLERRRIEQSILSDALRAGVPPNLVPLIFNGIYTTGANLELAAELQRQWSTPGSISVAPPTMSQQQNNPGPAPPAKLPGAPQPIQQDSRQRPRPQDSDLPPAATDYLPGTRNSRWSEATSRSHRDRVISSEREQLRRKLKAQNVEFADMELLDTAFEHTFPVTSSMMEAEASRHLAGPPDKPSGTREKRRHAPQKAHPRSSLQSRSKPQQQPQTLPRNPANASNPPSQVHPEQTNIPSPKRKDQRLHREVPPRQYRRNEIACGQQELFDEAELDQKQQQRDLSSSHESRACEGCPPEQPSESNPASVGKFSANTAEDFQK